MQVEEILTYAKYFEDMRFVNKKPNFKKGKKHRRGDNIYELLSNENYKQHKSRHTEKDKDLDLSGENVLISKKYKFYYFGKKAKDLPENLNDLKVGRGHKNKFTLEFISQFEEFIKSQKTGIHAMPTRWSDDENCGKPRKNEDCIQ
jgi:hypothetical protein